MGELEMALLVEPKAFDFRRVARLVRDQFKTQAGKAEAAGVPQDRVQELVAIDENPYNYEVRKGEPSTVWAMHKEHWDPFSVPADAPKIYELVSPWLFSEAEAFFV